MGFFWDITPLHPTRAHHPLVFSAQYQTGGEPTLKHVKRGEDSGSSELTAAFYRSTPITATG